MFSLSNIFGTHSKNMAQSGSGSGMRRRRFPSLDDLFPMSPLAWPELIPSNYIPTSQQRMLFSTQLALLMVELWPSFYAYLTETRKRISCLIIHLALYMIFVILFSVSTIIKDEITDDFLVRLVLGTEMLIVFWMLTALLCCVIRIIPDRECIISPRIHPVHPRSVAYRIFVSCGVAVMLIFGAQFGNSSMDHCALAACVVLAISVTFGLISFEIDDEFGLADTFMGFPLGVLASLLSKYSKSNEHTHKAEVEKIEINIGMWTLGFIASLLHVLGPFLRWLLPSRRRRDQRERESVRPNRESSGRDIDSGLHTSSDHIIDIRQSPRPNNENINQVEELDNEYEGWIASLARRFSFGNRDSPRRNN